MRSAPRRAAPKNSAHSSPFPSKSLKYVPPAANDCLRAVGEASSVPSSVAINAIRSAARVGVISSQRVKKMTRSEFPRSSLSSPLARRSRSCRVGNVAALKWEPLPNQRTPHCSRSRVPNALVRTLGRRRTVFRPTWEALKPVWAVISDARACSFHSRTEEDYGRDKRAECGRRGSPARRRGSGRPTSVRERIERFPLLLLLLLFHFVQF